MPEQNTAGAAPSIAIGLESSANLRLIRSVMGNQYSLQPDLKNTAWEDLDLIIVDAASLERHRTLIQNLCHQNAPMILPVLLVSDARQSPNLHTWSDIGVTINDVLRIPTSRSELLARVDNLLHLRQLSRTQENARRDLANVVGTLQILNACDEILVRANDESSLLEPICQRIIHTGNYDLAWIGVAPSAKDATQEPEILATAGNAAPLAEPLVTRWFPERIKEALETGKLQHIDPVPSDAAPTDALQGGDEQAPASGIIVPLTVDMGPPGYLAICSSTRAQFDTEKCELLKRLGTNLAYTLNAHRLQTERERQSAEIQHLAFSDALTGLPNRHYLTNYLDSLLQAQKSGESATAALLFIDLDGFKIINDALGHEAGDEVLIQVGHRLQSAVRESDLIIRQGGDEFLVVMFDSPRTPSPDRPHDPKAFRKDAGNLANRIISSISSPFVIGGQEQHLSASIGISLTPDHGNSAAAIIQAADTAMYEAKKVGGTTRFYSPSISDERRERLTLENRLRHAIDREELELHFQPLFDMQTRSVTGAEALVRWPQVDGSMLSPGTFIPLAEETGLIRPMGDWILWSAASQLRAWHDAGHSVTMSVNLSLKQLQSQADAARLHDQVKRFVDPDWITLEVTESLLSADPGAMEALIHQLHEHGFGIAIDDFGTGYSSLSRLQHMAIQTLKIDRSFVDQIDQSGKGAAMVPIICQMAESFGLNTVAEGIENENQYEHLRKQGVGFGQGFWYGRPVPEREFRDLFLKPGGD